MASRQVPFISRYRWHIAGGLLVVFLLMLYVRGLFPLFTRLHTQTVKQIETYKTLEDDTALPEKVEALTKENKKLVKTLQKLKSKKSFDETEVLSEVYQVVDSIGFNLSKLQVGEPISGAVGKEVPIEIEGSGSYNAIGKLIAHMELMDRFTRIVVCSIKKSKEGPLRLTLSVRVLEVQK